MSRRWADEGGCVWKAVLHKTWRRLSKQGACHPQQTEGVVFPKKVGKGRLRDGIIANGWGHSDAWSKRCAGGVGLQIDANAMAVLDMLQQEPGTGKRLLTCGTYIT